MVRRVTPAENSRSLPFPPTNDEIADRLLEIADLLTAKEANPFRVRAYYNAAKTIREFTTPVADLAEKTTELTELPGIGDSIAGMIEQYCQNNSIPLLDRLRGKARQETIFTTVAGVGPKTAELIHEKLGIDTLEALEVAAYDGRLGSVPGIGHKRLRAVRESLAGRFQRYPRRVEQPPAARPEPPIEHLLSIDEEYRRRAKRGQLVQISPLRFNPDGKTWLPILKTRRGGYRYTALFSNTPLAHQLGMTHDWVVIYRTGDQNQWTVTTEHRGIRSGRRIVKGREAECDAYYAQKEEQALPSAPLSTDVHGRSLV